MEKLSEIFATVVPEIIKGLPSDVKLYNNNTQYLFCSVGDPLLNKDTDDIYVCYLYADGFRYGITFSERDLLTNQKEAIAKAVLDHIERFYNTMRFWKGK